MSTFVALYSAFAREAAVVGNARTGLIERECPIDRGEIGKMRLGYAAHAHGRREVLGTSAA
jgi:hypothetical protein